MERRLVEKKTSKMMIRKEFNALLIQHFFFFSALLFFFKNLKASSAVHFKQSIYSYRANSRRQNILLLGPIS